MIWEKRRARLRSKSWGRILLWTMSQLYGAGMNLALSERLSMGLNQGGYLVSQIHPGNFAMANGVLTVNTINPFLAGITSLSAAYNNVVSPVLTTAVSTFTVLAAAASKIQLVLPGETAQPGNLSLARGVTGTPRTKLLRCTSAISPLG